VERPKRTVDIYDYLLIDKPVFDEEKGQESFGFEIECSKGTYVRSLVNDLGEKLGKPAVMTELRRTASSGFDISQAVKLSEIEANPEKADELIQPIDAFFTNYETIDLSDDQWKKVQNGAWIKLETDAKKVALRYNKKVKAIYENKGRLYCPSLMLLQNE
nr:tRNA pseudouridine(55) synthase TruB [Lactobacillus amylovorus]